MEIRKVSETATVVTLGWEPVAGATGYRFTVDGKISHTWDGTRETVRVAKDADRVLIEVLGVTDSGVWPAEPVPGSPPLWNGDWETGNRSQYGGLEYVGEKFGKEPNSPPWQDRVIISKGVDGVTPLQGDWFAKMVVKPGDQYGGSSGWRTIFRQYNPIRTFKAGYESWWVFACRFPSGYPNGANVHQAGPEFHQTKAPYVSVTGSAPFHFIARDDHFYVDVFGGRDRDTTRYVAQTFAQDYAKNHWHVVAFRYKHGLNPNGEFELWYGPQGGTLSKVVEKQGIGTMYEETDNHMMFGLYRAQTGTSDMVAYFDAFREYKTEADALAFARSLL